MALHLDMLYNVKSYKSLIKKHQYYMVETIGLLETGQARIHNHTIFSYFHIDERSTTEEHGSKVEQDCKVPEKSPKQRMRCWNSSIF